MLRISEAIQKPFVEEMLVRTITWKVHGQLTKRKPEKYRTSFLCRTPASQAVLEVISLVRIWVVIRILTSFLRPCGYCRDESIRRITPVKLQGKNSKKKCTHASSKLTAVPVPASMNPTRTSCIPLASRVSLSYFSLMTGTKSITAASKMPTIEINMANPVNPAAKRLE